MGNFFAKAATKVTDFAQYCWTGVWREPHNTMKIRVIKTISLAVRSFMDRGLQTQSASLLFAIGRGFGFQDLLESSLLSSFPAQRQAIQTGLKFVDSYLKEASSGIFVGVGILMLLWTLVSLLSTIEQAFNTVWDIKKDRNIYQKITDYIAICLLVPVLMICSSGVSIFMSTIVQNNVQLAFLSPVINVALEASPVILAWMAFSLSYFLIPNTKVQFKYAAIAGLLCAIGAAASLCQRPDLCLQIQCHLRLLLFPAPAACMAAALLAGAAARLRADLRDAECIRIQFPWRCR